ncbi:MAG: FKBP-type peptidyl-prolyl cis-trans isomerase [Lewinellaceae bacterium]|nr:FKBP-type peptidyl-prolyl cis-trans isomerase [Phaeodactylibacter sp.]MCB0612922.1 FKBP-type peptidyl-prolyl cis-trans isomerase [Phaeodactylibacter sp.]MCB9348268.1 FKBP-type peptidyl-prolyl cis-trans isomerase [Lewinellaceae bacterium]
MVIDKNKVVTLHYKLQEGSAEGNLIEETHGKDPLVFLYGIGQMIPEFERQLAGKKEGDTFSFGIQSSDAYGEHDSQAIVTIPKDSFVVDGELASDLLEVDKVIPMRDGEGNQLLGTVMEVREDEVLMDFNHPMAGVDLYFTGNIESIREATASELEHGHVHGAGGHQH